MTITGKVGTWRPTLTHCWQAAAGTQAHWQAQHSGWQASASLAVTAFGTAVTVGQSPPDGGGGSASPEPTGAGAALAGSAMCAAKCGNSILKFQPIPPQKVACAAFWVP